jgi:hypothetical protein
MLECQRVNNPASERWMSIWAQNLKAENTLSTKYIEYIKMADVYWHPFGGFLYKMVDPQNPGA